MSLVITAMKVVVLVTYLFAEHGIVEGPACAFGFAPDARSGMWGVCQEFQLQQTVAEHVPPGYMGQVFVCELRDKWPDAGRCF